MKKFGGDNVDSLISNVEKYMIDSELDFIEIGVIGDFKNKKLIPAGFIPKWATEGDYRLDAAFRMLVSHYVEGLNLDEMTFWFQNESIEDTLNDYEQSYIYANLRGWQNFARKTANSLPLLMFYPTKTYKSNRPMTDMSMFRYPSSMEYVKVKKRDKYTSLITTDFGGKTMGIPVTRYAQGVSKGLFFKSDSSAFCGTFYYYEPESTTFLGFETYRIYRNKYEAVKSLYKEFNIENVVYPPWADYDVKENTALFQFYNGSLKDDLKYTPEEFNLLNKDEIFKSSKTKHYVGVDISVYAIEDHYDQDLCNVAKDNGIDVIILTNMAGKFQIVTEILDTRVRLNSFANLFFSI